MLEAIEAEEDDIPSYDEMLKSMKLDEFTDKFKQLGFTSILDFPSISSFTLTNRIGFEIGHMNRFKRLLDKIEKILNE